jgi:hypothetical protein
MNKIKTRKTDPRQCERCGDNLTDARAESCKPIGTYLFTCLRCATAVEDRINQPNIRRIVLSNGKVVEWPVKLRRSRMQTYLPNPHIDPL